MVSDNTQNAIENAIQEDGLFSVAEEVLHTLYNRLKKDEKLYFGLSVPEQLAYTAVMDYCENIALLEDPGDGMSEDEGSCYSEEDVESRIRPEVLKALGAKPGETPVL